MKKVYLFILICCLLFILAGCGGAKEIQNETYITAIGLDYSKGEYIVYLQALNFSNIAKQEGGSALQQAAPVFIAQSKGKSIQAAVSKLEQNAALPLYYGHVNTYILSEKIIKKHLKAVIESIGENSFLRYNCWLYGTKKDMKEILLADSFFNYPSLNTIIHNPEPLVKSNFSIPIEKYNRFISKYYQTVGSYIIPSVDIKKKYFLNNTKPSNIASVNGGFVISQQKYKGWVKKQDLNGLKWFSRQATRIPLSLFKEKVSVVVMKPKATVKVLNGPKPSYRLIVKAKAILIRNEEYISLNKIQKVLAQKIKKEIVKTINKGDALHADLLNITEKPYRYKYSKWNINTINTIDKGLIKEVQVKLKIDQTVNYKR